MLPLLNSQSIMTITKSLKWTLKTAFLLLGAQVLGTACHEIVGHGLTGVLCGGTIVRVEIIGLQVYPEFAWIGWHGQYGSCSVHGISSLTRDALMGLGGSMSTWAVSLIAIVTLWCKPWSGWPRTVLIYLGIWWIDLLTYTLPTWGLRRSLLWGGTYSEPYVAATSLGVPGWLYQVFVLLSCAALAIALGVRIHATAPGRRTEQL